MRAAPNLDILPMACVGLILVLIMMVVSPLVVTRNQTVVDVPEARTAERKVENDVTITMKSDRSLFLNDSTVADLEQLASLVASRVTSDPYVLVVVRADKECLNTWVLDLLSTAKRAGAVRIACATTLPAPKRGG
jgi:biopolymer transport protein ExbD